MSDATPKKRSPNQRVETDARILDAALQLLASDGADGVTLPAIAKASGYTTGPVYARFGGPEDVLVALWDVFLRDELRRVLREQLTWLHSSDDMPDALRTLFEAPGVAANALVELLAVLRRFPIAFDFITPQIEAELEALCVQYSEVPRAVLCNQIGHMLGSILIRPLLPTALQKGLLDANVIIRQMLHEQVGWHAVTHQREANFASIPEVHDEEPVRRAFLQAALVTIAATGVSGASTSRIARSAGHSFTSAYHYFQTKDQLAEQAIEQVIRQFFTLNTTTVLLADDQEYYEMVAANQRGTFSSGGRPLRQLRLECAVAARRTSRLAQYAQSRFAESSVQAMHYYPGRADGTYSMAATWSAIAVHAFSFPLLAGCSLFLEDMEWAPIAAQLRLVRSSLRA